ncbi:MAG TPA: MFS transporter, partial [Calditrichaeota bacterium]|nr:MFS transporter [Calditrichota bacterium]
MKLFGDNFYKRNFLAFLFHGVFLNMATAFSQLTTIQSSFVYLITGSSLLSGVLFAANRAGMIIPQMFLAPIIEKRAYKKIFLLLAVSIRGVSWLAIAVVTYFYADTHPQIVALVYFAVTLVFFLAGGMGDVTYYDILAKSIPTGARGRLSGAKILFGGALSMAAGYLTKLILSRPGGFGANYALLFLLTAFALFIAFFGFYSLKEPPGKPPREAHKESYKKRVLRLVRSDHNFMRFVFAEFFLNASMILFPFYVIYAKEELGMPLEVIGIFVTIQIVGELVSGPVLGWIGDRYNFRLVMILVGAASFMA